ncbi:MAG: FtsK/SpoIIIE domain-containing protein, partial [Planktothrix sp.]
MKGILNTLKEIKRLIKERERQQIHKFELDQEVTQKSIRLEPKLLAIPSKFDPKIEQLEQELQSEEIELNYKEQQCKNEGLLKISHIYEEIKLAGQVADYQADLFEQQWLQQQQNITEIRSQLDNPRLLSASWNDPRWTPSEKGDSYQPQSSGLAPGIVRIGEFLLEQVQPPARVPALIPIRDFSNHSTNFKPGHIAIFSSDAESRQAALAGLESIALRVVSTFPVRKLKGIFIDPVSMGKTFQLKSLHQFISGPKTYTRSDDIREQLRGVTEHIEQVLQNY